MGPQSPYLVVPINRSLTFCLYEYDAPQHNATQQCESATNTSKTTGNKLAACLALFCMIFYKKIFLMKLSVMPFEPSEAQTWENYEKETISEQGSSSVDCGAEILILLYVMEDNGAMWKYLYDHAMNIIFLPQINKTIL